MQVIDDIDLVVVVFGVVVMAVWFWKNNFGCFFETFESQLL